MIYFEFSGIFSNAREISDSETVSENLTYLAPAFPNPEPGVTTIPLSNYFIAKLSQSSLIFIHK